MGRLNRFIALILVLFVLLAVGLPRAVGEEEQQARSAVDSSALQSPDAKLRTCNRKHSELQSEAERLRSESKQLQNEVEHLQSELKELRARSETSQEEIGKLQSRVVDTEEKYEDASKQLDAVREAADKKLSAAQAELANMSKKLGGLEGCTKEVDGLMKELTEARSLLSTAKNAWLPLWSHSHYDTHVQPLIKVYNEEVASGRVLRRSASAASDAYRATHAVVAPSAAQAYRVASKTLQPIYDIAAARAKAAHISIAEELSKPTYKPYVDQWNDVNGRVAANWQAAVRQLQAASKHHRVKRAKQWVTHQAARVEADLQRILTHLLKADEPGSGITPENVQFLGRAIIFGIPGLLLIGPLLRCFTRRRRQPSQSKSGASKARSAASKASKKSKRG